MLVFFALIISVISILVGFVCSVTPRYPRKNMYGGGGGQYKYLFDGDVERMILSFMHPYTITPLSFDNDNDNDNPFFLNKYMEKGCLKAIMLLHEKNRFTIRLNKILEAVNSGHLHIVKYLTENLNRDQDSELVAPGRNGYVLSPLKNAISRGYLKILNYLLDNPRFGNYSINLSQAIEFGYLDVVNLLLNSNRTLDFAGAIETAAKSGYVKILSALIEKEKTVSAGFRTLSTVCRKGYLEIVKLLVRDNRVYPEFSAIDIAAEQGYLEIVKTLLNNDKYSKCSYRALDRAMDKRYFEISKILIDHKKSHGLNPISFYFGREIHPLIKSYLDDHKYDVEMTDEDREAIDYEKQNRPRLF